MISPLLKATEMLIFSSLRWVPIIQPHPIAPPKSFGTGSPVVAFLWEGSRVQEGSFQEHQLVIEHPDLQGAGVAGSSGHSGTSSPAATLHLALNATLPGTCSLPLLTWGWPSAVLICSGPRLWLPPQTSPLQSPEALQGTASILGLWVQGSPCLNIRVGPYPG